ncbi:MAG: HlyD family efflux transporter periplasmic adaptor subunit, partial [Phycisphaerae bacterium]|nr:HlyD family efflux transporter periplasmic adaptor subunit [Phycisphaerae bacterium]
MTRQQTAESDLSLPAPPSSFGLALPGRAVGVAGWARTNWKWLTALGLAAVVALGGYGIYRMVHAGTVAAEGMATRFVVTRGPMRVLVTADGTIRSDKTVDIKSEIGGMTRILEIVPESTRIPSAGEFLVRLDTSDIEKQRDAQLLKYKQAAAAATQADNELDIQLAQNDSDIRKAQQAKDLAAIDVEKYEKGDFPQGVQEAQNLINIAQEELQRADDKLQWSKKLKEQGYISGTELAADELAFNKAKLDVALSNTKLDVLRKYTYAMESSKRKSTLKEATAELEKVKARAAAQEQKFRSDLDTKTEASGLEGKQLAKLERQLAAGVIKSPQPGLVVYATTGRWRGGNQQAIDVGYQVREGESIISLPDLNLMVADVNVPEAKRTDVLDGQSVVINIEAQPNNPLVGRVKSRGIMPVQQDFWRRGDVQQFQVVVTIDNPPEWLLPGLRCSAVITVAEKQDVVQVPIQAVFQREGVDFCFVDAPGGARALPVLIGMDDDKMVEVKAGLEPGQKVLLAEPENPAKIKLEDPTFTRPAPVALPTPADRK